MGLLRPLYNMFRFKSHTARARAVIIWMLLLSFMTGGCRDRDLDSRQHCTQSYLEITLESISVTNCTFRMRLHNPTSETLQIPIQRLPWNHLTTVITDTNGNVIQKGDREMRMIRDWPVSDSILRPFTYAEAIVSLDDIFYETAIPHLTRRELIMFWTYRMQPRSRAPLDRDGGWLTIPTHVQRSMLRNKN